MLPHDLKNFRAIDWDWVWLIALAAGFAVVCVIFIVLFLLGS